MQRILALNFREESIGTKIKFKNSKLKELFPILKSAFEFEIVRAELQLMFQNSENPNNSFSFNLWNLILAPFDCSQKFAASLRCM